MPRTNLSQIFQHFANLQSVYRGMLAQKKLPNQQQADWTEFGLYWLGKLRPEKNYRRRLRVRPATVVIPIRNMNEPGSGTAVALNENANPKSDERSEEISIV